MHFPQAALVAFAVAVGAPAAGVGAPAVAVGAPTAGVGASAVAVGAPPAASALKRNEITDESLAEHDLGWASKTFQ